MIVARTLDHQRLSYDGVVYVAIPSGVPAKDAVVIHKKRLPYLRGVSDAQSVEYESAIRDLLDTLDAHEVLTESCDRDGDCFCDCLDRAIERVRRGMSSKGADDGRGRR